MRFLKVGIKKCILNVDQNGLIDNLKADPAIANEMIICGIKPTEIVHPLHYICDCVFEKKISDQNGKLLAEIFIAHGAKIDGNTKIHLQDTPLVAACSLHAEEVAVLYIDQGADIHHQGCHGGTPLHWAAWTGRDKILQRLLEEDIDLNRKCSDFGSTALFWGFHGYKNGGERNRKNQFQCCEMLLSRGANQSIPNIDKLSIKELLDSPEDKAYLRLLDKYS